MAAVAEVAVDAGGVADVVAAVEGSPAVTLLPWVVTVDGESSLPIVLTA